MDEEEFLFDQSLQLQAFDHDDLEESVATKAGQAMLEKEREVDLRLVKKETNAAVKVSQEIDTAKKALLGFTSGVRKVSLQKKLDELQAKYEEHQSNIADVAKRIAKREADAAKGGVNADGSKENESRRDFLIRKGLINHFTNFDDTVDEKQHQPTDGASNLSHQNLKAPGFGFLTSPEVQQRPRKLRKPNDEQDAAGRRDGRSSKAQVLASQKVPGFEGDYEEAPTGRWSSRRRAASPPRRITSPSEHTLHVEISSGSESEYYSETDSISNAPRGAKRKLSTSPLPKTKSRKVASEEDLRQLDDGNELFYKARLLDWATRRQSTRANQPDAHEGEDDPNDLEECYKPHPTIRDHIFRGGLKLPGDVAESLFEYQKTCVDWLWNLYSQRTGGIVGDEMGLGKTIQTIAFVAALHYSKKLHKPVIIVCPATVLRQWSQEFHRWWPPLRVSILHASGSGMSLNGDRDLSDDDLTFTLSKKATSAAKKIVNRVTSHGHVLVTTYHGLCTYRELLLPVEWDCVVLDEGHKIKNPDTAVSLTAKHLKSETRIILSGTPIQNNLIELWCLFDFVYPGKLGVLPVFKTEIADKIKKGGYVNASNLEVTTANKCAAVLREITRPYILRRFKADVTALPEKHDQVLFCNLVQKQKEDYERYLKSKEVGAIIEGRRDALSGIDALRKICNHPDLTDRELLQRKPGYKYGLASKSGKMQIVKGLLQVWEKEGHKCLIFSQGQQMLDILESFVRSMNVTYRRMDGSTPVAARQRMVDEFNTDDSIRAFLLTTKVGGLGVNLTGATRIIIFDPDWNPSNDLQARERSWRLGQTKPVKIYRLLVRGTIEEKIYQRQLFKQFLTKKVLDDPEQRRIFRLEDMHDLFTLGTLDSGTETGLMFEGVERQIKEQTSVDPEEATPLIAIPGVARVEKYIGEDPTKGDGNDGKSPRPDTDAKSDEHVDGTEDLESMLARAGVHSIFEHENAIGHVKSADSNVERLATRAAQDAAEALERSSRIAQQAGLGAVTWTGRSGTAGRDESPRRPTNPPSRTSTPTTSASLSRATKDQICQQLVAFLKKHGGRATSDEILAHFNPLLPANSSSEFKPLLKSVALLDREAGCWKLKGR